MPDPTILLCGGTGMLGGEVARRLAARHLTLRALVRPTTDASALTALGFTVVRGDMRDRPSLDPAVAGVTTVISTVTAMVRWMMGAKDLSVHDVDEVGYANLIDACEQAGVQRFVYASIVPFTPPGGTVLEEAKFSTEERLRASTLREVVVRADMIQESWLAPVTGFDWPHGKMTIYGNGRSEHAYVSNGDYAEAMIRLALADDPPRVVEIGGPEAMSRMEAAAAFEQATGHPMHVRHIPRVVLRAGSHVGLVQPLAAQMMRMMLAADLSDVPVRDAGLRALGIEAKPVSRYIREVVAAAAG
jgi:uncharacterized protein YbjT (DUF2867 family)